MLSLLHGQSPSFLLIPFRIPLTAFSLGFKCHPALQFFLISSIVIFLTIYYKSTIFSMAKQKPIIKKEKSFLLKLLADGETNTISSKRLCMLLCLIMLVVLAILSAFGYNCMEAFVYVFASLAGAQSGFTTIEKCTKSIKRINKEDNENSEYE